MAQGLIYLTNSESTKYFDLTLFWYLNDASTTYLSDKDVDDGAKQFLAEDMTPFITKDLGLSEVYLSQIRETFSNDIYKMLHESINSPKNVSPCFVNCIF